MDYKNLLERCKNNCSKKKKENSFAVTKEKINADILKVSENGNSGLKVNFRIFGVFNAKTRSDVGKFFNLMRINHNNTFGRYDLSIDNLGDLSLLHVDYEKVEYLKDLLDAGFKLTIEADTEIGYTEGNWDLYIYGWKQ